MMQLTFNQLVPVPLREKIALRQSGIWDKDLTFNSGDFVFVQAPSGTGKTTLVHILYGMRTDYSGSVKWGSSVLQASDAEVLAKFRTEQVSVIFQDMRLFPELTAWENLDIKRRLTNTVTEEQVTDWLARVGIAEKRNALASTLSYGEQQRVSIIRALVQPFEWLLMDEPFSHLDHENIQKAINLISEVVQQRKAGLLLADLDANTYFPYSQTILL